MVGRRKLPDFSLNRIFNALSIGVLLKTLTSMNLFWPAGPNISKILGLLKIKPF